MCHTGDKPTSSDITTEVTIACQMCHTDYEKTQSHPSDIYPSMFIPNDLPLTDSRLTCLTCHYAHINKSRQLSKKHYFLRRPVTGIVFCSACHKFDEKRHIVIEKVHKGEYEVTDRATRIDTMSLDCIQCHDSQMAAPSPLGAGKWTHMREGRHPIGISYAAIGRKKADEFRSAEMLDNRIKLYDGKIGCGTCHNVYSKSRNMLVIDNGGSRLCLECHIK